MRDSSVVRALDSFLKVKSSTLFLATIKRFKIINYYLKYYLFVRIGSTILKETIMKEKIFNFVKELQKQFKFNARYTEYKGYENTLYIVEVANLEPKYDFAKIVMPFEMDCYTPEDLVIFVDPKNNLYSELNYEEI